MLVIYIYKVSPRKNLISLIYGSEEQQVIHDTHTIVHISSHKELKLLYYRPQRSWAKAIFLQASVCPQGGRGVCLSACWDTHPPPQIRHIPPRPSTPSGADTPQTRQTPREQTPHSRSRPPTPGADPPGSRHPPEADCSIRLMSGRYASYWNAFLFSEKNIRFGLVKLSHLFRCNIF